MQVSSAGNSSPAQIALSLQSAKSRDNSDRSVTPVGPRAEPLDYPPPVPQRTASSMIDVDAGTEKKLSRIKEVQVAFKAALSIADSIESQYLLDPIV